jgi:hypothetical protein
MRATSRVVPGPERDWRRLDLAPRLHTDETLSSWMERFAGAYALKVRDFAEWLGYRPLNSVYATEAHVLSAVLGGRGAVSTTRVGERMDVRVPTASSIVE